jgi:hypothetical protein
VKLGGFIWVDSSSKGPSKYQKYLRIHFQPDKITRHSKGRLLLLLINGDICLVTYTIFISIRFLCWRSWLRFSARRPAILPEILRGFLQDVPCSRRRPFHFRSFPVHSHSPILRYIQSVPKRCIHKVNIPYYNVYTSFWDTLYITHEVENMSLNKLINTS